MGFETRQAGPDHGELSFELKAEKTEAAATSRMAGLVRGCPTPAALGPTRLGAPWWFEEDAWSVGHSAFLAFRFLVPSLSSSRDLASS